MDAGFRGADPAPRSFAVSLITQNLGRPLNFNQYRTAPSIVDYVNLLYSPVAGLVELNRKSACYRFIV